MVVIWGVDFSGARDAEKRIWIAKGREGTDALASATDVTALAPLTAFKADAKGAAAAARALADLVMTEKPATVGIDAPLGVPARAAPQGWARFVTSLPECFTDAEAFRAHVLGACEGREVRRACDVAAKTPFAVANLRLYRQSYHAMADFAAPLLRAGAAVFPPMQAIRDDKPLVLETCPASALKAWGRYRAYKGAAMARRAQRETFLEHLAGRGLAMSDALREIALEDAGGDALDALIALEITARTRRAIPTLSPNDPRWVEAEVFY
jgi:hypothetical protein